MTEIELEEHELNHLCWALVSDLDRWMPELVTAKECMDGVEEIYEENDDMDYGEGLAWEEGYHTGAVAMTEEHIRQLRNWLDIDVLNRAEQHRQEYNEEEVPDDRVGLLEFELPHDWLTEGLGNRTFGEENVEQYLENGGNTGEDYKKQVEEMRND